MRFGADSRGIAAILFTTVGLACNGAGATVEIDSATCTPVTTSATGKTGQVVASGTAAAPVGSILRLSIANGGQPEASYDCAGWTQIGSGANNTGCAYTQGGPTSVLWTVTQDVAWCTSGCDSSTAETNVDDPVKHLRAWILDPNSEITEALLDVTCT